MKTIFQRVCLLTMIILGAAYSPMNACTPAKADSSPGVEIWCCCDADWQECAMYLTVTGSRHGIRIGIVVASEYCSY